MDESTVRALARNYSREFRDLPPWKQRLARWCLGYKTCHYLDRLLGAAEIAQPPDPCICGGEPHVSHCPANRDPFLKGLL